MSEELLKIARWSFGGFGRSPCPRRRHIHVIVVKIRKKDECKKDEESGNEKSQEKQECRYREAGQVRSWHPNRRMEKRGRSKR